MKYVLILLVFLASCATQDRCAKKFPPSNAIETTDSIIIHDSIVVTIIEQVHDTFKMKCSENGVYNLVSNGAKVKITVENGEIKAFVNVPGQKFKTAYKTMFVIQKQVITKTYTIHVKKKPRFISKLIAYILSGFAIVGFGTIVFVILKFIKP